MTDTEQPPRKKQGGAYYAKRALARCEESLHNREIELARATQELSSARAELNRVRQYQREHRYQVHVRSMYWYNLSYEEAQAKLAQLRSVGLDMYIRAEETG
jgi:3'-phosphoadenosine 5'-phosphosulfate (PAPS) 3'-phosphatase